MFTQAISMDCTKEQYEKYLRDELLKMGYNDNYTTFWTEETVIVNNSNGQMGDLGTHIDVRKEKHNRTYLGSFSAPLFLALAAMTDSPFGGYGEYYTDGKYWLKVPFVASNTGFLTTATREEIIERFGRTKELMWKSYSNTTKNLENIYTAIELLKSKGYKILKPTTWEEV